MKLKEWLIEYITQNPNVSFGSVYRDACYAHFKVRRWRDIGFNAHDGSLFLAIDELVLDGLIVQTKRDNNTFYNLGTQPHRDKLIDQLIEKN